MGGKNSINIIRNSGQKTLTMSDDGEEVPFSGVFFERPSGEPDLEWQALNYGYAYANYANNENCHSTAMDPLAVFYAENEEDVENVLKGAVKRGVAVALKSGGHSYMGACSTTGANVCLDVSGMMSENKSECIFKKKEFIQDGESGDIILGVGPGVLLGDLVADLDERNVFVPFGECSNVCVGGHAQSGGVSPTFSASLGYLVDYVQSYTIFLADGSKKVIRRPDDSKPPTTQEEKEDAELFWGVAGGSPGNFGVVTWITIKTLKNSDWQAPREFKMFGPYNEERVQRLTQLSAACHDSLGEKDPKQMFMPPGAVLRFVIVCCSDFLPGLHTATNSTVDIQMRKKYPDLYDPSGGRAMDFMPSEPRALGFDYVVAIQVTVLKRVDEDAEEERVNEFFDKCKAAFGTDAPLEWKIMEGLAKLGSALGIGNAASLPQAGGETPKTMSALLKEVTVWSVKSYPRRYIQACNYGGEEYNCASNSFVKDTLHGLLKIIEDRKSGKTVLAPCLSFLTGGPGARSCTDGKNCAPWRATSPSPLSMLTLLAYYGPDEEQEAEAVAYINSEMNTLVHPENGSFSKKDMRSIGLPWGTDPESMGRDMDKTYKYQYWENDAIYNRLLALKKKVDKNWTFSANPFGIGASQAPQFAQD